MNNSIVLFKKFRTIATVFIIVSLLFTFLPDNKAYASDVIASGDCGENGSNVTFTLDNQGLLTISGNGNMADWRSTLGNPWYDDYQYSIKRIVINEGVTSIGSYAFFYLPNLTEVSIPESVLSIGDSSFWHCSSLSEVYIPDSVTYIGSWAFNDCSSLESVNIPKNLKTIESYTFQNCSSLTNIRIPEGVTSIGMAAFNKCSNLKSINIPESVTTYAPGVTGYDTIYFWGETLESVYLVKDSYFDKWYNQTYIENEKFKYVYKSGDHYFYEEIVKQPSYTETGLKTIECIYCDEYRTVEIPKLVYKGWSKDSEGNWYYGKADGTLATGWLKVSGKWYYFNASGAMQTGWHKLSNKWYYFSSSGVMQTGWVKLSNKWYYFNSSGEMQTGWKKIGGKDYFFKSSGTMATNEWVKGYYWINKDGTWTYKYKASWRKSGSKWWFTDTSGWYAKNTTITIDGKKYTFDKSGWLV